MTAKYEDGFTKNIFQQIDDESSLCVLGLCLASNDIVLNQELLHKSRSDASVFYFSSSLSILREVAKIVKKIDVFPLRSKFSHGTKGLLQHLKENLLPFQDDSLTKGILKPVRDFTFHYDFTKDIKQPKVLSILGEIRSDNVLRVRASIGDNSCCRYRYTFADIFRNKYVDSYLTKETVSQISEVAVNTVAFTDSLLSDLM